MSHNPTAVDCEDPSNHKKAFGQNIWHVIFILTSRHQWKRGWMKIWKCDWCGRWSSRFPRCISSIFVTLTFVMKYSRRWRPSIGGGKLAAPHLANKTVDWEWASLMCPDGTNSKFWFRNTCGKVKLDLKNKSKREIAMLHFFGTPCRFSTRFCHCHFCNSTLFMHI